MKCIRTWYCMLVGALSLTIVCASAATSFGQAFSAGNSALGGGNVNLGSGDSDGGPPVQPTPQPPTATTAPGRTTYPGPLLKPRRPVTNNPLFTPRRNSAAPNRNWGLGGEPRRATRPGRTLAELLQQRELARTKYEYGGGYSRDLRDYNDLQREIVRLQDQRMQTLRSSGANPRTLRQAEKNYRATRGLNAGRYRGVRDTRWPAGERATSRWLSDPNYQ